MRSLLRFAAGSTRHKGVFDICYRLRIKGIDVGILSSCTAKDILGDESMHEEGWADVRARLEKVFEDGCCVRQLSGGKRQLAGASRGEGDGRHPLRGQEINDEALGFPG